jgi:hypothetical protein
MNSYSAKILVTHPGNPDAELSKEFDVNGVVEWDDAMFVVRRATGEVLFQDETRLVHKSIDVPDLLGPDPQISLSTPDLELEIEIVRKHRQTVVAGLRKLIESAAATSGEFRGAIDRDADKLLRRGAIWLSVSLAALVAGGVVLGQLPASGSVTDFVYFVLFWFVIGVIAGSWLLYTGFRQRRITKGGGS